MMRTSVRMIRFPPTRWISFASMARSSLAWASGPRSPTSSRKRVPWCASSNRPILVCVAPVKAPRSWPNISLSTRSRGIAAQFTRTNGFSRRGLASWIALATSSLPVPDSPVMSTRASVGATRAIICRTVSIALLLPTICPPNPNSARNARATRRVCRSSNADDTARRTPSGVSGFSRKLNAPSFVALTGEQRTDHAPNVRLIVGDEDYGHLRRAIRRRSRGWLNLPPIADASPFRQQLRGESLPLGDSLDLDRNSFERLLDPLETPGNFAWNAWILGLCVHLPRICSRQRNTNGEDNGSSEGAKRDDYFYSHFNQSFRRERRLRVS